MRASALLLAALLATPSLATAQVGRLPRPTRGTPPPAAPLPPEIPAVAHALAYTRSRWSGEGYALVSAMQVPGANGGTSSFTTFGAGTRADYRVREPLSVTADITASFDNSPSVVGTAEVGARYRIASPDTRVRPFADVRAAYTHMYDSFASPAQSIINGSMVNQDYGQERRYSRGLGAIAGTGLELSLTNSLALTTEVLGLRNHMTTYRVNNPTSIPLGNSYWDTSYRFTVGLRYNARRVLQLAQNPRQ